MNIERAREMLGDLVLDRSDEEMENFLTDSKNFVNVILDRVEEKDQEKN